jgi:thioredoxin 1
MGEAAPTVTDATFDVEVLKADKPVVVDFWAPWCGPCRQVSPILDEIAAEHGEKLRVVKLNADENPAVTAKYGVQALPTLAVFTGGELVKTIVGAKPKQALLRALSDWLI